MNSIIAFLNGIKYKDIKIYEHYKDINTKTKNRINKIGDFAELYIKDLYCDSILIDDIDEKYTEYKKIFSYIGGKNTPPDAIVNRGEAVEIKKQESISYGDIALNSSHPADYLHRDSSLITKECRECEEYWEKKNMVYSILNFNPKSKDLISLWFVYGNCLAADREVYSSLKKAIQDAVLNLQNLELKETNELGKVFNIDALEATNLRIRGMWNISHPEKVFKNYIPYIEYKDETMFKLIMLEEDFNNLNELTRRILNKYINDNLVYKHSVQIPNPNDKTKLLKAIFLCG